MAGLAACTNAPPPPLKFPPINFSQYAPIRLDVGRVDVVARYVPSNQAPHVEGDFPLSLLSLAETWGHQRLVAAGENGSARVTIKDASVIATPLATSNGLKSLFTSQQAERYTARLDVVVEILDPHGFSRALVEATAQRSTTLAEDVTPNRRDAAFYNLEDAVITDLNASLDKNIHAFMARYILSGP